MNNKSENTCDTTTGVRGLVAFTPLEQIKNRIVSAENFSLDIQNKMKDMRVVVGMLPAIISNEQETAFCNIASKFLDTI